MYSKLILQVMVYIYLFLGSSFIQATEIKGTYSISNMNRTVHEEGKAKPVSYKPIKFGKIRVQVIYDKQRE